MSLCDWHLLINSWLFTYFSMFVTNITKPHNFYADIIQMILSCDTLKIFTMQKTTTNKTTTTTIPIQNRLCRMKKERREKQGTKQARTAERSCECSCDVTCYSLHYRTICRQRSRARSNLLKGTTCRSITVNTLDMRGPSNQTRSQLFQVFSTCVTCVKFWEKYSK